MRLDLGSDLLDELQSVFKQVVMDLNQVCGDEANR